MIKYTALLMALAVSLMAGAPASAQKSSLGPASASIRIEQVQVAFIGSAQRGGGSVTYQGRTYPITVGGLGIGGIGASKLTATGSVYGLRAIGDLAGPYIQLREGWALGDTGRGRLWLRNGRGVTLRLTTHRKGIQLSLGADGVVIGFKR
ncbi:hypothetical protein ACFONL_18510 [Camelimonas fluminis]|uniref:DUF1134 domain-containing protein n=1 Tax=Camelimonas fluminis TaxID=1576911 RepID=A0ABV7UKW0_9HYPH|nr:hypothetical protein [Camelimonas fluminis]